MNDDGFFLLTGWQIVDFIITAKYDWSEDEAQMRNITSVIC